MSRLVTSARAGLAVLTAAVLVPLIAGPAFGVDYENLGGFTIPSLGDMVPTCPQTVSVQGQPGVVADVNLRITGLTHGRARDLDVLLVSPTGLSTVLMSDIPATPAANSVTLTFDQDANAPIVNSGFSGTFQPNDLVGSDDVIGCGAPAGPYAVSLDTFFNSPPNGTWSLYVRDNDTGESGSVQSWRLSITTATPNTYTVTNTLATGPGSLAQAITDANGNFGQDLIDFAIAGPGPHIIAPTTTLPTILSAVVIDATSEPDAVVVSGASSLTPNADGLTVATSNVTIRDLVVNDWAGDGISVNSGSGVAIEGCIVGLNHLGSLGAGNGGHGVNIAAATTAVRVGGGVVRNVISSNTMDGVHTLGANTQVLGNYIGTDATGTFALGNDSDGVESEAAASATYVASNVLSGNALAGVRGQNFTAQSNLIGLRASGAQVLQNSQDGVAVIGPATVGGTTGNTISGNGRDGVRVTGGDYSATIAGNLIGTNEAGVGGLGNLQDGVHVALDQGTANGGVLIGGTAATARNVIAGNSGDGVDLLADGGISPGNTVTNDVQGNWIGVGPAGGSLGNSGHGVVAAVGDSGGINRIGGSQAGAGNRIENNSGRGVTLLSTGTAGSPILGNSISSNGLLGIDLANDGITFNDGGDADTGPNGRQNYPGLGKFVPGGGTTAVNVALNSKPNRSYRIEFFRSPSCDGAGRGEGATFMAATARSTGATGALNFGITLPGALGATEVMTATATDLVNNETSEFSACSTITAGSLRFSVGLYKVFEHTGLANLTVIRGGNTAGTVQVNYATSPLTATPGVDYLTESGIITFVNGESSKTVGIAITNDSKDEVDETFKVTLSSPTNGATLGNPSTTTVQIVDTDQAPIVSINNRSVSEPDSGSTGMVFTVSLSAASAKTVTMHYATASGSAVGGSDYTSVSGTLTFSPGQTARTISVPIRGDTTREPNETFKVNLSSVVNGRFGDSQGIGTILNDD